MLLEIPNFETTKHQTQGHPNLVAPGWRPRADGPVQLHQRAIRLTLPIMAGRLSRGAGTQEETGASHFIVQQIQAQVRPHQR